MMPIHVFYLQHLCRILSGTNVLITFRLHCRKLSGKVLTVIKKDKVTVVVTMYK